jgi:Flp pilus assembly protein TadD
VPVVADTKPEKPLAQKVDIAHAKETNVLANAAPKVNDALGIKVGATRTKLDVNYELERAYNALIAGKSEVAIQIYEDILTGQPKNKEALFGLASTYHRLGQIDIARSLYGKLLEIDPKHRDGLNNFLVLLADEAPQEALTQMERLEAQNPAFSPIPAQMAIIYQKLGDRDKAIDKMYRALSIAPENITYRYNLAIMLDKNGKYEDAGKLYTQLLDSHAKGAVIPGDATKIQQRLTFIRSNTSR